MDETGSNTHGKDDSKNGGERLLVPEDEIPKDVIQINDAQTQVYREEYQEEEGQDDGEGYAGAHQVEETAWR